MPAKTYLTVLAILILLIPVVVAGRAFKKQENITALYYNKAYAQAKQIEVLTAEPESEHDRIVLYIKKTFGQYSDKAFQLLTDPKCHENGKLNPLAVNDNTTWGGIGQDIGIFQINTTWQGVTNKAFLTDYKININIAYNIFVRSGNNFKLWTCGRVLGI